MLIKKSGRDLPFAPVETKGYKSMINLPDWIIAHKIVRKSKKQFAYRVFFTLGRHPFTAAHQNTLYAILLECGAVHVWVHNTLWEHGAVVRHTSRAV